MNEANLSYCWNKFSLAWDGKERGTEKIALSDKVLAAILMLNTDSNLIENSERKHCSEANSDYKFL